MCKELTFEPFKKISRLKRGCTITEKIDGTNAQLCFSENGDMLVGSRKRQIWPEGYEGKRGCDNAGFAKWAYANQEALFAFLGKGRHYGEWCGSKIQRTYGLEKKYFALFNVVRFGEGKQVIPQELKDIGLTVVPVIYEGEFATDVVDEAMDALKANGSYFASGFMNPEGVVVYHHALRDCFKVTYDHDKTGKNRQTDIIKDK